MVEPTKILLIQPNLFLSIDLCIYFSLQRFSEQQYYFLRGLPTLDAGEKAIFTNFFLRGLYYRY